MNAAMPLENPLLTLASQLRAASSEQQTMLRSRRSEAMIQAAQVRRTAAQSARRASLTFGVYKARLANSLAALHVLDFVQMNATATKITNGDLHPIHGADALSVRPMVTLARPAAAPEAAQAVTNGAPLPRPATVASTAARR